MSADTQDVPPERLPALAGEIDPKIHYIEFRMMQCRSCGVFGPAVDVADRENPDHNWDNRHMNEMAALQQDHSLFWAWGLTRSRAEIWPPAHREKRPSGLPG